MRCNGQSEVIPIRWKGSPKCKIYSVGSMDICTKLHGNLSHKCEGISPKAPKCQPGGTMGKVSGSFESDFWDYKQKTTYKNVVKIWSCASTVAKNDIENVQILI